MAHVTFIHGISNKPPAEDLLRIWRETLASTASAAAARRPRRDHLAGVLGGSALRRAGFGPVVLRRRAREHACRNRRVGGCASARAPDAGGSRVHREPAGHADRRRPPPNWPAAAPGPAMVARAREGTLERVPLPWFLKQRVMNAFLRDVHHYLFDVEYGPPGHPAVHIQQIIRQRFVEALCAPAITPPHVVVSHSMGTVIAYDCLKRVGWLRGAWTASSPSGARSGSTRCRTSCSRVGAGKTGSRPHGSQASG